MNTDTKVKHTQGEWKLQTWANGWFIIDDTPFAIATVERKYRKPGIAEANAKLIAAAPDLLEALQLAEPYITDLEKENFNDPNAGIFSDNELTIAFAKMLAAIKKATL